MKEKTLQILTVSLFCGFLAGMSLLYFLLPEKTFSQKEKRVLSEFPDLEVQSVLSGDWGENTEKYLADHMPGRDFYVGLNAYFDLMTGRQQTKDIRLLGDALVEAPVNPEDSNLEKNLRACKAFADNTEIPVDLMLVPSAGWVREAEGYPDSRILDAVYGSVQDTMQTVDLREVLDGEDFYRTDHHWTSGGAWKAYKTYVQSLGKLPQQTFQVETIPGFLGSTYSRSGLWLTESENLELWHGREDLTAEYEDQVYNGIFQRENLQKADKYTVFLGGNHPLVTVRNPEAEGKILLIRDSFSNCLGGFLAESFGEVTMTDLRYYKQPVSRLLQKGDFDRVLICYGLGNFLTDQNLIFLTR